MTNIYLYAGGNDVTDSGDILCASASLLPNGKQRYWSIKAAMSEARSIVKRRKLTDVAIHAGDHIVWADAIATAYLYPETGTPPAPIRIGHPGAGNGMAQSAVICPWDETRHRIIPYA